MGNLARPYQLGGSQTILIRGDSFGTCRAIQQPELAAGEIVIVRYSGAFSGDPEPGRRPGNSFWGLRKPGSQTWT